MGANPGGQGYPPNLSQTMKNIKNHPKIAKFVICPPNNAFIQNFDPGGVGWSQGVSPNIDLNPLQVGSPLIHKFGVWGAL